MKTVRYYGVAEIANKLGVTRSCITNWIARDQIPQPIARLAMGPIWINNREFTTWLKSKKGKKS